MHKLIALERPLESLKVGCFQGLFCVWKLRLKDNREVGVRFLSVDDKNGLFDMFASMSPKALEYSGAPYTVEIIERWINNLENMIAFVAEYAGKIVGYAIVYRPPHRSRKGIGDLAIYLHQDFHGVGLGTAMTKRLLEQAKKGGMHKIQLSVVAENLPAIRLYEKYGFKVEGTSEDAFFGFDGKYHDMILMGLILD
jgi:putative acetyltransferase